MRIYFILCFMIVFIGTVYCQQNKHENLKTNEPIVLDELILAYDKTIDTTGLKIFCVLEMERKESPSKKEDTCGGSNFIVLYDNFSGHYFSMGCASTFYTIYWVSKNDTLFFYSQDIGRKIKREGLREKEKIAKYIYDTGERLSFGFDCDYLIQEGQNCYRAYNKTGLVKNFLFRKEEKVKECHLGIYNCSIRRK